MVAVKHKHHKAVVGALGGDSAAVGASGNRISTYTDNAYANIASEINALRNGQGPINRITENLSPVVKEDVAMAASRQQAQQNVNTGAAEIEREAAMTQRVDTAVGYADTAMQVAGFAPLLVGGAQLATKGVSWVGNKVGGLTGLKSASTIAETAKEVRSWNEITFNEIGHATGTKGIVGGIAQTSANIVAAPVEWLAKKTGSSRWSARANNVSGAIKSAPGKIAEVSASHGLMNTAFIGMSVLSMFGDARGFTQNLASLKQMYADMTGEDVKNVSTMKILTGNVPEPVAAARSHMVKIFGIKQLFDVGNIALNVLMMVSPKFSSGWKGIAAMIGTQMASTAVDGYMGESILPIHKAFSDAYKSGKQVPPDFYAAYVYAASAELRSRGDKGQEFAAAVAQQYAQERASPGQLLNEVQNGKLLERIKGISAAADKPQQQPAQEEPAQSTAVSRLSGERAERPVVGKFTNKLNQEGQMAAMGQGVG